MGFARKRVVDRARGREGATSPGTLERTALLPHLLAWFVGVCATQVNGQNVVKVGHRQVVNMIRQGGNTLMVKVVMVTRHPDMDEAVHKKGAWPAWHSTATSPRPSGALVAGPCHGPSCPQGCLLGTLLAGH